MTRKERQKPTTQAYRDNWDRIFGKDEDGETPWPVGATIPPPGSKSQAKRLKAQRKPKWIP